MKEKELIQAIRETNDSALINELFYLFDKRCRSLSWEYYHNYKDSGLIFDDFYSIALASVDVTMKKFDLNRDESPVGYWRTVTVHQFSKMISKQSYAYGARAFDGISLDDSFDEESLLNAERIGFRESDVVYKRDLNDMLHIISNAKSSFTKREKEILSYLLEGLSQDEMIKRMKVAYSTFRSQYTSLMKKIRTLLKDNDII